MSTQTARGANRCPFERNSACSSLNAKGEMISSDRETYRTKKSTHAPYASCICTLLPKKKCHSSSLIVQSSINQPFICLPLLISICKCLPLLLLLLRANKAHFAHLAHFACMHSCTDIHHVVLNKLLSSKIVDPSVLN